MPPTTVWALTAGSACMDTSALSSRRLNSALSSPSTQSSSLPADKRGGKASVCRNGAALSLPQRPVQQFACRQGVEPRCGGCSGLLGCGSGSGHGRRAASSRLPSSGSGHRRRAQRRPHFAAARAATPLPTDGPGDGGCGQHEEPHKPGQVGADLRQAGDSKAEDKRSKQSPLRRSRGKPAARAGDASCGHTQSPSQSPPAAGCPAAAPPTAAAPSIQLTRVWQVPAGRSACTPPAARSPRISEWR